MYAVIFEVEISKLEKEEKPIFEDYKINIALVQKSYTLETSDFDK